MYSDKYKLQYIQYIGQTLFWLILLKNSLWKECVSKKIDVFNWIVIYQGDKTYNTDLILYFLRQIQQNRCITFISGKYSILKSLISWNNTCLRGNTLYPMRPPWTGHAPPLSDFLTLHFAPYASLLFHTKNTY